MNKHGLKVFKIQANGETYYVSAKDEQKALDHLVECESDENSHGYISEEFPKEKWSSFEIDFTHDLGNDSENQTMEEYMNGVFSTEIICSSEFN